MHQTAKSADMSKWRGNGKKVQQLYVRQLLKLHDVVFEIITSHMMTCDVI